MTDLSVLESDLLGAVAAASDLAALEEVRVSALGKHGSISALLKGMGAMSPDERKEKGPLINGLRDRVQTAIAERKAALEEAALSAKLAAERVDLTLPAPPRRKGSVHPTMQVMDELVEIFAQMGFEVAEGPDIEDDWHNFTALNFPPKHPAREMHDTFFFNPDEKGERKLLRTHTSPVQVRTMVSQKPPIRIVAPGRVFRCDSDQTHTPMFHQIEGLVIDRDINMGHLKWTLETFLGRYFETDTVATRFRPHHFPFTEPSAEMDVRCDRSGGEVKVGQGDSWLEILGCGMVHPNVLRQVGIDPNEFQGFAFGLGVDRLAMLKYGMPDLRDMFASDTRWLQHYGFSAYAVPNAATGLD
ncbi:phenylalanine--tRNA ligase subunit alpha [Caulobacter sp. 17J80-11]|uniref:phenylalanine--tRNA ligase subunit alpha n=1 Tax=Caulobacter sp. 17J80-11 TaxID=2763502 RepID=UPI001653784C|nr:phenylalanine--tRNA ligase subunit alpha [Caulobacter sp. 17J80-11]MBC6982926.1 phenylalanine--tRNA ligase subunit alpha [Caulobacter sp. 17J80-11]